MSVVGGIRRWLENPLFLEWEEPLAWSDYAAEQSYQKMRELARVLAVRAVPTGALVFVLGFWLVGRIPGNAGRLPYSIQATIAAGVLLPLLVPCGAVRFLRPQPGTRSRVRFRLRGPEHLRNGHSKPLVWRQFDAFDFGSVRGVDILKLRLRGNWLTRLSGPPTVVGLGLDSRVASSHAIRTILQDRGLREQPLEDPSM